MSEQQTIFPVLALDASTTDTEWFAGDNKVAVSKNVVKIDINEVAKVEPVNHSVSAELQSIATDSNGKTIWVIPPDAQTKVIFKSANGETTARSPIYLSTRIPAEPIISADIPAPDPNTVVDIFLDRQFLLAAKEAGLISVPKASDTSPRSWIKSFISSSMGRLGLRR